MKKIKMFADFILIFTECTKNQEFSRKCPLFYVHAALFKAKQVKTGLSIEHESIGFPLKNGYSDNSLEKPQHALRLLTRCEG